MTKLLVIDDEPNILFTIQETLQSKKLQVLTASTAREGLAIFQREKPGVVLLDVRLPDMSGLDAFREINRQDPRIPVVIMTAYSRTDTAIEAMRTGAYEYLVKPVDLPKLRELVERAVEVSQMNHTPVLMEEGAISVESDAADYIIGQSQPMQAVYKSIGRIAHQDVTVLILGESGVGKELVARAIYQYSQRADKPFLAVNCAALSESLLESELFGHERGAFTGADSRRIGKFEQVNGGTIFLDEIGDMSLSTQAKSLRLLQQQQFERLGGNTTIQTDVRIIAATNKDLAAMVEAGTFRQDLYYRLSGFTINVPPLRERPSDIPNIARYLLAHQGSRLGRPQMTWNAVALEILSKHSWPGNVRELSNAVQYAIVHTVGDLVTEDSLPESCRGGVKADSSELSEVVELVKQYLSDGQGDVYRRVMHKVEQAMLTTAYDFTSGNQQAAAELLGISRMTLRSKMRTAQGPDVADEQS